MDLQTVTTADLYDSIADSLNELRKRGDVEVRCDRIDAELGMISLMEEGEYGAIYFAEESAELAVMQRRGLV